MDDVKIKYQRKPVYCFTEDLPPPEKKRRMKCISGISGNCFKEYLTTSSDRVCAHCEEMISKYNLTVGIK